MEKIYFDSAATAVPCAEAVEAMIQSLKEYGNPSSLHFAGMAAREAVEVARKSVAATLCCETDELYFTGGGSESNNTALFGIAAARERFSKRIVISDSEHPSVDEAAKRLSETGFEVIRIPTTGGRLDTEALKNALSVPVSLVSVMLCNNETGAYYDIGEVRRLIDSSSCGAVFHCDAVQGYLKTGNRAEIRKNCDIASISAHKIGGIKGVGALFVKKGVRLHPLIRGGGQERGLRSGTENTAGIAAFGAAASAYPSDAPRIFLELNDYTRERLTALSGGNVTFRLPDRRIGAILSVSVPGVRSEVMLNALSAEGICVSAGSACSSKKGVSRVLSAYGCKRNELESAIRISFGTNNTKEECEILARKINEIAKRLKK